MLQLCLHMYTSNTFPPFLSSPPFPFLPSPLLPPFPSPPFLPLLPSPPSPTAQEVETEQYFNYFLPQLSSQGYEGIFQPKSRARTMQEEERKHVDGCAIFYHNSK